ncbi:MAG: tetratricopeptide repeat protein [Deltaproteobacteria bacterium]|nr:tetratricopeptide repeat protein [Deltaproteobacteria bacterium]
MRIISAAIVLLLATPALAGDPYADAMARAKERERAGDTAGAAAELARIATEYSQDTALQLRLGWLAWSAGDLPSAEKAYRTALTLAPESKEARLGLGWTLERAGRCDEARPLFEALAGDPEHGERAREGLAACRPVEVFAMVPTLDLTAQAYVNHPGRRWAIGPHLGLPMRILENGILEAHYRYLRVFGEPGTGTGAGAGTGTVPSWDQYEAHLSAGFASPRWGAVAQYALADDGSGSGTLSHVVGATGRYSPLGDIVLAVSASLYPDLIIGRGSLAWRVPINDIFSVEPGGALQLADRDVLGDGFVTLRAKGALGELWIGGKFGPELRPAYLSLATIYNVPERIFFGAWAGGRLAIGEGFLLLSWEWYHSELPANPSTDIITGEWDAYLFTVGGGLTL